MFVAESRITRRLVGRLDRGSEVVESLRAVCRSHGVRSGELRASGALEQAVLSELDRSSRALRPPRRFDAALEILHLASTIAEHDGLTTLQPRVTLSRERDNGIELLGGQLISGRVFQLEFVIDVFDDLVLTRAQDAATGLALLEHRPASGQPTGPAPSAEPAPPAPAAAAPRFEPAAKLAWEEVMAASASQPAPPARPDDTDSATAGGDDGTLIQVGDLIEHPKFGRCQVERVEGDHEFVSARLRNQRLIRLSLDVITLVLVGEDGGKKLFRAKVAV